MERAPGAGDRPTRFDPLALAAGFLNCLLPAVASTEGAAPSPGPMAALIAPLPAPRSQDWFGAPLLPEVFRSGDPEEPTAPVDPVPQEGRTPLPPESLSPRREEGKGLSALDLQAWQEEDDLRFLREWAGDVLLGVPLLLPQLVLEAVLPRGLRIGPTTFLYRTSPASSSLVLVVLDQMLFHEAEFFAQLQEVSEDGVIPGGFSRGQKWVVRRSFMSGLRATYAVPGLTAGLVRQAAADFGTAGLLLAPPLGAALLYFKGIDQKVEIDDNLRFRFKLAGGQDWVQAVDSKSRMTVLSVDVRIAGLPVGLLGSFELSSRGMTPSFIGIGTSLSAVEELLGREARRWQPVD